MWSTAALWNSEPTIPGRPLSAWWWSQCPRRQPTSAQDVVAAAARENVTAFIQVSVLFRQGFWLSRSSLSSGEYHRCFPPWAELHIKSRHPHQALCPLAPVAFFSLNGALLRYCSHWPRLARESPCSSLMSGRRPPCSLGHVSRVLSFLPFPHLNVLLSCSERNKNPDSWGTLQWVPSLPLVQSIFVEWKWQTLVLRPLRESRWLFSSWSVPGTVLGSEGAR